MTPSHADLQRSHDDRRGEGSDGHDGASGDPRWLDDFVAVVAQRMGSSGVVRLDETRFESHPDVADGSVVVSSGVERASDPTAHLSDLRRLLPRIHGLVMTTALHVRPENPTGDPVASESWTMQWTTTEFVGLLQSHGLDPLVHGHAGPLVGPRTDQLAFVPGGTLRSRPSSPAVRCLAILPCYNELDVICITIDRLLAQRLDVHVIDNWSTDGTWELLAQRYAKRRDVTFERFPSAPNSQFQWAAILDRMDLVAAAAPHDWIIHVDADEQIDTCSPDIGVVDMLTIADDAGYDVIDFTLIDFRPEQPSVLPGPDHAPEASLPSRWEFATRPGARMLERAWKNRRAPVELSAWGGHAIGVEKRIFPLNMILRHYPLRSAEQARRKVFRDRVPRFESERAERGWHTQYDGFDASSEFVWPSDALHEWTWRTPRAWVAEFSTRAGLGFG